MNLKILMEKLKLQKKYFKFDNNLKKKTFSVFDIKKDFFNILLFWPLIKKNLLKI